jgi:hypothetical protein
MKLIWVDICFQWLAARRPFHAITLGAQGLFRYGTFGPILRDEGHDIRDA